MKLERTKNTANNILWGSINRVNGIVLPFILRTILIYKMGVEYSGLNSLFTSILTVLNLAELGFSTAIVYNMYKPIAENDENTICALLALYKKVYHIIGIMMAVIGLSVLPFLDRLIDGGYSVNINIYILYLLYLFNMVISYFLFAYKSSLLAAHQRNDIISNVDTVLRAILYISQAAILIVFKNYYLYCLSNIAFTVINNVVCAHYANKLYPRYVCRGKLHKDKIKGIKKDIQGLLIGKICIISRNSFDNVFLSAFLGLKVVTIYGNYYYIMSAICGFLQIMMSSMSAGIGNSIAMESVEKNYFDLRRFTFIYSWLSGWCFICLLNLFQPFMKIWMGKNLLFPYSTVILLCLYFYALTLGDVRSQYSSCAGLFWENRHYVIAESITNLVLNYLLGKSFGANGIILATLLSIILINYIWGTTILFNLYFKSRKKLFEYFYEQMRYWFITLLISIGMIGVFSFIHNENFMGFCIKALLCLIIPNFCYYIVYRKTAYYKESKNLLISAIYLLKQRK